MLSQNIENYKKAVTASGGEIGADNCDGLILCGGSDISPSFYNQANLSSQNVDCDKDLYEFQLLKQFIERKKPILGICRGMQIINVFFGGTLHQHVENHKNSNGTDIYHAINIKNGFLTDLYGGSATVNSCHHQAVNKVGQDLIIAAYCNNVIESIFHKALPIFGVQWHPERLDSGKILFDYFLWLCKKH